MGVGNPNSGPHVYLVGTFPTEPSLQPSGIFFFLREPQSPQQSLSNVFYFICMGVSLACMSVYLVPGKPGEYIRSLELEFQMVVEPHMGAVN